MADITRTIEIEVNTKEAVENVDNLNESLEESQQEMKQTSAESKKYNKQMKSTSEGVSGLTDKLDSMTGGFLSSVKGMRAAVKGLNLFKVALAATGIGAVILAIGALSAAFRKLQGPISFVEDITAGLSAVFNEVIERVGILGEAIGLLFSGEFSAAVDKAGEAFKDLGSSITAAYEAGEELAQQERDFLKLEAERLLQIAELERRIEQQKLTAEDQSKAALEREQAASEAFRLQQERVRLLIDTENQRIALEEKRFELSTKTQEDEIALLNTRRDAAEAIVTLEGQLVELNNSYQATLKEVEEQVKATTKAQEERLTTEAAILKQQRDQTLQLARDSQIATEETTKNYIKSIEVRKQATEGLTTATEEETDTQEGLNNALQISANSAQGLLDILSGKTTGKDIFKFLLSSLGAILSLTNPTAGGIFGLFGGLFEDGGLLKGPSHSQGGIWINAEGGEGIINKRSMAIPWVRDLASELNQIGGGVKFADGGVVAGSTAQDSALARISEEIGRQRIVLPIEDLRTVNTKVSVLEDRSEF